MNHLEQQLQYPFNDALPGAGVTLEVAPGVRWLRMPLPFALDHINLWLLRDKIDGKEGWTIVDCGISSDQTKTLWDDIFRTQLEGLPVLRLLVTHMHPDHIGLAYWLCERWNIAMHISMTDYMTAQAWSARTDGGATGGERAAQHLMSHGMVDPDSIQQIRERSSHYPGLVPRVPPAFVRMMNGTTFRINGHLWTAIAGYGHAPEHMSLYCDDKKVLISGDMVLPRISTNISVFDYEPMGNPLPLYLNSLHAYDHLPDETLVLPSHGRPFKGLHVRIAQQHTHHADRLAEVYTACAVPQSTTDILPLMFKRKLDLHQTTFAMGEAAAHLHALYYENKLNRELCADGIIRFTQKA